MLVKMDSEQMAGEVSERVLVKTIREASRLLLKRKSLQE